MGVSYLCLISAANAFVERVNMGAGRSQTRNKIKQRTSNFNVDLLLVSYSNYGIEVIILKYTETEIKI